MAVDSEITGEPFRCAQCGVCCRTQEVVLLTLADVFRLAGHFGVSPDAFYRRYCMRSDRFSEQRLPRIYLKVEGGCPFLRDGKCSVHEVKPIVCSQSPFYYVESSLAVLKVLGVVVPGCSVERLRYDTVVRGDRERLADMEIEVNATDEYMAACRKFDGRTAQAYLDRIRSSQADPATRTLTQHKLLDEALRREDVYRNDPYYKGATLMYLSGFYRELQDEIARQRAKEPALVALEPAAVGVIGRQATVVLQDGDFKKAAALLRGREGDVTVRAVEHSGIEYAIVTVTPGGSPPLIFYYYVDRKAKPSLAHEPGKVTFTFMNGRRDSLTFSGADRSGWLAG